MIAAWAWVCTRWVGWISILANPAVVCVSELGAGEGAGDARGSLGHVVQHGSGGVASLFRHESVCTHRTKAQARGFVSSEHRRATSRPQPACPVCDLWPCLCISPSAVTVNNQ
jgi:hypothetical protein